MKSTLLAFLLITYSMLSHNALGQADDGLIVYSSVPGADRSDKYSIRVRRLDRMESPWQQAFPLITRSQPAVEGKNGYFSHLNNWTNTYINFEMSVPVQVAISRVNGKPIQKARVHPQRHASKCFVDDGQALITLTRPCLISVDIDGQLDEENTGKGYTGPPLHTITIFANPILSSRPKLDAPGVIAVPPGQLPPQDGDWKTLVFLPGVHDIGIGYPVQANRQYYIPGDALVYGTLRNTSWSNGHNIRIFGYGTLSGARIAHPKFARPRPEADHEHDPIYILGARGTSVEGITLADSAHHSLMLISPYTQDEPTTIQWSKILAWRVNGDGINPFENGLVEDCFIRTQDDSTYISGRGMRRITTWNDYNGSSFVLSALPDKPLIVEDCDVIYSRAGWNTWSGGRVFNMRGEGEGACGQGVVFRNIRVEDPRPTLQQFFVCMEGFAPYSTSDARRGNGDLAGVFFQNINIAATSVLNEPDILWGSQHARINDIIFDNLTIKGKKVETLEHFKHNQHVSRIQFR